MVRLPGARLVQLCIRLRALPPPTDEGTQGPLNPLRGFLRYSLPGVCQDLQVHQIADVVHNERAPFASRAGKGSARSQSHAGSRSKDSEIIPDVATRLSNRVTPEVIRAPCAIIFAARRMHRG